MTGDCCCSESELVMLVCSGCVSGNVEGTADDVEGD
jgi:hypothetical protein